MFGTGLNLARELHLVQSLIYPGATFSTVSAKRYECPSMLYNKKTVESRQIRLIIKKSKLIV